MKTCGIKKSAAFTKICGILKKYAEAKYKSAASKKSAASSAFRVSRFGFRVSNFAFRVLRHLKKCGI
jgi:hypothetical protein